MIPKPESLFSRITERVLGFSAARLRQSLKMGMKSLWAHRLRSLLTVLGIVFGVCSVIAMLAIGEGASYEAQEQIRRLGSNNIIIRSVKPPEEQVTTTERSFVVEYGLRHADIQRIRSTIPGVKVIAPARVIRRNVWVANRRADCDVIGVVPWYTDISSVRVKRGRFFTDEELNRDMNVCVLEEGIAQDLFPITDPIGQSVRVDADYFRVVGIVEPRSDPNGKGAEEKTDQNTSQPQGAPNRMYIPLTSSKSRFGEVLVRRSTGSISAERVELHEATVVVADLKDVVETAQIIEEILRSNHKKKDYEIIVPLALLRSAERTKRIFNVVLGSVAALSLLVGGIGIMNIMLATVTERTREIGIRRALGARKKDITFQFLIETVLLSTTGGILGVLLGLAIPFLITHFAEMRTIVTLWSPLIAFSISAVVGVVFGIYPAFRAANMDPVEALRHE
ncbi:MAG TPA: ABC transporter permease [Candidatus Hydrogenedentes bacterium]|nr:ABC transporter permease [Candidatus Hydrogenedentota bacterium]HOL78222.1 ABC transporter permease [Candidatus Hydrogenedentota bacterium]HPO84527.1 ABC transporter permease [Candidatus Hydrogenedentota bacterium]